MNTADKVTAAPPTGRAGSVDAPGGATPRTRHDGTAAAATADRSGSADAVDEGVGTAAPRSGPRVVVGAWFGPSGRASIHSSAPRISPRRSRTLHSCYLPHHVFSPNFKDPLPNIGPNTTHGGER